MAQKTATAADDSTEYGYMVISERSGPLMTFATRHDAVGFAVVWEQETEDEIGIDAQPHRSQSELLTLKEA